MTTIVVVFLWKHTFHISLREDTGKESKEQENPLDSLPALKLLSQNELPSKKERHYPLFMFHFPLAHSIHTLWVRTNQQNPERFTISRRIMNLQSPCNVYYLGCRYRRLKAHQHWVSHNCKSMVRRSPRGLWGCAFCASSLVNHCSSILPEVFHDRDRVKSLIVSNLHISWVCKFCCISFVTKVPGPYTFTLHLLFEMGHLKILGWDPEDWRQLPLKAVQECLALV